MDEISFELDCDVIAPHFHDELEIMYILSGRIAVMLAGSNFVLGPEDIIVFNPFEYHDIYCEDGSHTLSAFIPLSVLQQADLKTVRCCSYIQQEQANYFDLLRTRLAFMFQMYLNEAIYGKAAMLSGLFSFLSVLKRQFELPDDGKHVSSLKSDWLREVLLYVGEHFAEEITLQDAADAVFLSKSHFSREFVKKTGMPFSDYLRKQRLNKAAYLLRSSTRSVTEIALECGFSNTNTMIVNFRQEYGETPNVYRKKHSALGMEEAEELLEGKAYYMSLLKHVQDKGSVHLPNQKQTEMIHLQTNMRVTHGELKLRHREAICVGPAKNLLLENVKNVVRRAQREIGFEYINIRSIMDNSLDFYHELEDGTPDLSFTYLDMIIDFLESVNIKPWIDLSYVPQSMVTNVTNPYGDGCCINLPDDLEKWGLVVSSIVEHFISCYGRDVCMTWRYSPMAALFSSYGVFSMKDYEEYYLSTYTAIREQLPEAFITSGMLDTGFLVLDDMQPLVQFLDYCIGHDCMPDEFSFQCFSCDYSKKSRQETEKMLNNETSGMQDYEPAFISNDPDVVTHELMRVREVLDKYGGAGIPVSLGAWNSTIWQGDLGNDTCFKAAYLFRSILENSKLTAAMSYAYLTDNTERMLTNVTSFSGGIGLLTYNGLPKAGYYAYTLLNQIVGELVEQGDGYVITRTQDRKRIRIGLYHYSHYNEETHISYFLPAEEQRTRERYYGFTDSGVKSYQIHFQGMLEGNYEKESYIINREHGSSYDAWMDMGAPNMISRAQREYLERIAVPGYQYEKLRVDESGEVLISEVLNPHEVRVICIDKK